MRRALWAVLLLLPFPLFSSSACGTLQPLPIAGITLCTHGGDPAATCLLTLCLPSTGTPPPKAPCLGDGTSGKRIQLFYGQVVGEANDQANATAQIRATADAVSQAYKTLGRNVRWVCSSAGQTVIHVLLASHDFPTTISTLRSLGYTSSDRIYTVMTRSGTTSFSGIATVDPDDRPANNANDTGPAYSMVFSYTDVSILMHETAHNMGAVQLSAPHSSGAWHCYDEQDLMCYADNGPYFQHGGRIWSRCPSGSLAQEFDCGRDDYFNPSPSGYLAGYLAAHWDLARSSFLEAA